MTRGPRLPRLTGNGHLSRLLLPKRLHPVAERVKLKDEGHGIDLFGLDRAGITRGLAVSWWLYEHYFRVESHGIEHVPSDGAAVLAANHSGTLPLDAMMLAHDLMRNRQRPVRIAMDYFVPGLPWINLLFTRAGGFSGTRGNFHALLDAGELVLAFPEGTVGIGKPFSQRYQLQTWRQGHVELAIEHQVPVVPIAVIGAEEQWPQIARIDGLESLGIPYLPIPATPMPLPVKYHLYYGEPIDIPSMFDASQVHDAAAVAEGAEMVRNAVERLIEHGLSERQGVFS
ncbi:MAG: acyltransferase family protein [Deltaproteobacteria bacterium]|nr:MAG: acyltransferase family protein [Deltaproteobacteria bacterium]